MQKRKHFLALFLRPPSEVTNFNTSSMLPPPFLKLFSLGKLNNEQKSSVKNRSTGPVRNRSTGPVRNRSTGVDFEIYRTGRVEKILTGSISGACDRVVGWHVSNVLSFSDHKYIRFQVKSRIQNQAKML